MVFLGIGALLILVSLPTVLWPVEVWSVLAAFSYRSTGDIEPSERRARLFRISAATTLTAGLAIVLGFFWPGTVADKGTAALYLGIVCFAAIIVVTIVANVRNARRVAALSEERRLSEEDSLPADEPSELAYGAHYAQIVFFGFVFFMTCGIVISTGDWTP